jgi:hypothetical protein
VERSVRNTRVNSRPSTRADGKGSQKVVPHSATAASRLQRRSSDVVPKGVAIVCLAARISSEPELLPLGRT